MRICHVLETAGGGSAQVALDLARYALNRGDDVTVLYAPDRAEAKFSVALASLPKVNILTSPMQRKVGLRDLRDGWLLFKTLRKALPFDIIHAHSSKAGALARIVGLFVPGKVIYTPHCFYSMTPGASKIYASIERVLSWLAPKIILVSQYEFRHAEQIGIAKNKLALIPNGITVTFPVTREQARKNLQINDNGIVIGFVGRMEPQKNPIRAIRAFQQIADQFPATQLVMVGDGALRAEMEAVLTDLDLNKRVSLLGQCDARSVIPAFDCLLCSSDFEAMPITFLEALATGIPIVTTPVGGTDEAVFEGLTGFIAKTPSVSDLATALTNFLNFRPEQRQKMAENAHKYSALFTTEIMGERHNELYKECLSRLSLSQ